MTEVLLLLALAQAPRDSVIASAARLAAGREPVEAVPQRRGTVMVRDVRLLDVDGDGRPEAFVWIEPQMRQTPFILVYTPDSSGGVRRLLEGLAPGRLQPVSGRLIDDHTLGDGVDMTLGSPGQPADMEKLLGIANRTGTTLVQYRTFFHADQREGYFGYVDLSDRALPDTTATCVNFEFSRVEALASGALAGSSSGHFLVALTTSDVTVYRFDGIRPNGTLIKQAWVRERPPNVVGLRVSTAGQVQLAKGDGSTIPLPAGPP